MRPRSQVEAPLLRIPAVKKLMMTIAVCAGLVVVGCGGSSDSSTGSAESTGATTAESTSNESTSAETAGGEATKTKPKVTVPKGAPPKKLEVNDLEEGSGAEAKAGDEVTIQYVGIKYKDGKEFDSTWARRAPFSFTLGAGEVIVGFDQGVEGMKVGGRRELIIPASLGYGESGAPPSIGPNEALVFVIDLLEAK
jgi:peptidylprolyl isomerase